MERLGRTGSSVLDANGRLVCEYSTDSIGYTRLQTDLEADAYAADLSDAWVYYQGGKWPW